MNQIKTHPQIHIIPFDLGCVFIDVLSIDNTKNLVFAKKFITELKAKYENNDEEKKVEITDNLTLTYTGKTITKYKYLNSEIADNAICYARLESGLYCYILSNGVGVFVLADIEGKALIGAEPKLQQMNVTLVSNYQKKITQSSILNRYSGENVLSEYKSLMLRFRKTCWEIVNNASIKKEIKILRKYSGNINYKAEGLSYVLTIYVFNPNEISDIEMNSLMYSSIFNKVTDKKQWDIINNDVINNQSLLEEKVVNI